LNAIIKEQNQMKTLKYIFLFLFIIVIIGAVYLATLDGDYDVKRSRIIKANPEVIFNDLNDYKNWQEWGPWYEQDSTITVSYADNTVGMGGSYSWTGVDGDGIMNTLKVEKSKSLDQEIIFKTPFGDMRSDVYWRLEKVEEGTKVIWGMKGKMDFFYRFMTKGMEDEIGPMEERGLELLDQSIQKKLKIYSIESEGIVDYNGGFYLYLTTSTKISEMDSKFPEMLTEIGDFVAANNIRTSGSPFTIYHKFDPENGTTMFSVCYPIPERIMTPKGTNILTGFMERGTYYKTTLKGSYDNSKKAWEKAMMDVENLLDYYMVEDSEPFEVYVNNMMTTANPADLITEIYIPVARVSLK
jgi:effector-binding domain-containing protein